MADFRKWILVLAVVALCASVASAQSTVNCQTSGGSPRIVRGEGTAELVGDVVLTCTGGVGVPQFPVNFQIFLNTDITSRLLTSSSSATGGPGFTEALLLVDDPSASAAVIGTNAFRGALGLGGQNLQWNGVPFTPPGTAGNTRTLRFTNIRANASKIPSAGIPNPITAYISVSAGPTITLTSNQVNVAQPQTSYTFSLVGSANALQCISQSVSNGFQFAVKFQEVIASAFRPVISAAVAPNQQEAATVPPSTTFNSESGYRSNDNLGPETGVATNGTRFLVQFNNPQAGVTINVSNTNINGYDATAAVANTLSAKYVGNADINGAGGTATTAPTNTNLSCSANLGGCKDAYISVGVRPTDYNTLTVNANGSAYATWEVLASSEGATEAAVFGVNYSYTSALPSSPALGTSGVLGNLAPAYTLPTGTTASATLPVPRFALNPQGGTSFTINPCVTDLLFPFVASTQNYDTGIVVANTTADPFSTNAQTGACTIWYYGSGAPPSQTSTAVPAGSILAFSLQNGGSNGVTGVGFFTGYIVIQCKFQFAHGFANISDPGLKNWASGYMALVMDQGAAISRGSNANGSPSTTIRETLTQ